MKKRLLSILLIFVMVLTMLPTAVFAEDALPEEQEASELQEPQEEPAPQSADEEIAVQAAHTHCYCGGSVTAGDHTEHTDVTYKGYKNPSNLRQIFWIEKTDVAYAYLEDDMTLDYTWTISEGNTLYLCLNGHTLNLDKYMILLAHEGGKLYLCDCSANQTGTVSGGTNRCVSVDDSFDYNSTFNMYGGTLTGGTASMGGGVDVTNGIMNMYGGAITENTATSDGGGIYVGSKGTLNLYGGTITKNTVSTNEAHYGGGIYVESNKWSGVGQISISGSPVVTGNTRTYNSTTTTDNVYLSHGFTNSGDLPIITLGTLTPGANIGIGTKKDTAFSTESETDYSEYFTSDDTGYHVEYNADKTLKLVSGAAHVHSGGTAYCNKKAVCDSCGKEYGDFDPNNHSGSKPNGWNSDDEYHWQVYSCCKAIINKAAHHGGKADCVSPATCEVCGTEYGGLGAHSFITEAAADNYLKSEATCTEKAVYYKSCVYCHLSSKGIDDEAIFEYGNVLGHDWGEWTSNGNDTHTRTCSRDDSHTETKDCSGGTATCQTRALCTICGGFYGEKADHDYDMSEWGYQVRDGHAHRCKFCAAHDTLIPHTPDHDGNATEDYPILCTECGYVIEEQLAHTHSFTQETVKPEALKSAATCTKKAVYYKSCTCGEISTDDNDTFEYGAVDPANHDGGTELKNKKDATCTEKGYTGDTYCKGCGAKLTDGKDIPMQDHSYGEWTIVLEPMAGAKGERERTCVNCNHKETEAIPATGKFVDVPAGSYYEDAVIWAAGKGIASGTDATHFSPNMICTRAEAVSFLWRAAGSPAPKTDIMPFTDVSKGSYYYDAVLWAVENGITAGTTKTTFSPNANCTRAQAIAFLWRAEKSPAAEGSNPFTDVSATEYYYDAVLWAVENGVTVGTSKTTYGPNEGCTRAQIVTFVWRWMK